MVAKKQKKQKVMPKKVVKAPVQKTVAAAPVVSKKVSLMSLPKEEIIERERTYHGIAMATTVMLYVILTFMLVVYLNYDVVLYLKH